MRSRIAEVALQGRPSHTPPLIAPPPASLSALEDWASTGCTVQQRGQSFGAAASVKRVSCVCACVCVVCLPVHLVLEQSVRGMCN